MFWVIYGVCSLFTAIVLIETGGIDFGNKWNTELTMLAILLAPLSVLTGISLCLYCYFTQDKYKELYKKVLDFIKENK